MLKSLTNTVLTSVVVIGVFLYWLYGIEFLKGFTQEKLMAIGAAVLAGVLFSIVFKQEMFKPYDPTLHQQKSVNTMGMPPSRIPNGYIQPENPDNMNCNGNYNGDDTGGGSEILGGNWNKCSLGCGSKQHQSVAPPDENMQANVAEPGTNYVPNNYTCSNATSGSGTMCLTRSQALAMENRYGNA